MGAGRRVTGCAGERPLVPRLQASLVSLFLSMSANQGNTEERRRARLLVFYLHSRNHEAMKSESSELDFSRFYFF